MFTSVDKFIVAAIGVVVTLLTGLGVVIPEGLTDPAFVQQVAGVISALLTALGVYAVPNKEA